MKDNIPAWTLKKSRRAFACHLIYYNVAQVQTNCMWVLDCIRIGVDYVTLRIPAVLVLKITRVMNTRIRLYFSNLLLGSCLYRGRYELSYRYIHVEGRSAARSRGSTKLDLNMKIVAVNFLR